jgi:hypothetical protein
MVDCTGCGSKCCKVWGGRLWDLHLNSCPYLTDNGCAIYPKDGEEDMRPKACIDYPGDKKCLNQTLGDPMVVDKDHQINIAFIRNK